MHVMHPVCCGLAGPPTQLTACRRRVGEDGTIHTAWRDFGPTSDQRLALRAWRDEPGGPIVVLESTGGDWQPIDHVLGERLEGVVAPAHAVRQRPGVVSTAAGYQGGYTPNPTYEEVCSARTGHAEVVKVVFDPARHTAIRLPGDTIEKSRYPPTARDPTRQNDRLERIEQRDLVFL